MFKYFLNRLKEPSTWRGLALLAGVAGAQVTNAQIDSFIAFGLSLSGMIGVFLPDPKGSK